MQKMELSIYFKIGILSLRVRLNYHDFNATKHGIKYILFECSEDFPQYLFIITDDR